MEQGHLPLNVPPKPRDRTRLLELMIYEFTHTDACTVLSNSVKTKTLQSPGERYLITYYDTREYCVSFHGFVTTQPQADIRAAFRKLSIPPNDSQQQYNVRVILQRIWDRSYVLDGRLTKQELRELQWAESHTGLIHYPFHPDLLAFTKAHDFVSYEIYRG